MEMDEWAQRFSQALWIEQRQVRMITKILGEQ
jgi:hypothetical protein